MMHPSLLILAASLFSSSGFASAQQPPSHEADDKNICGIGGASAGKIYQSVTADKAVKFHENLGEYETYIDEGNRRLWTFTRPGSKRPPAVICRTITPRGAASTVSMEIGCFGTVPKCETLREEWTAFLNVQLNGIRQ